MKSNKIAFIICCNNDIFLNEAINYINLLDVPNGFTVELLTIQDADSMLSGMQEGQSSTDAKYKIYMHQDVFILNRFFLHDILTIFDSDPQIGLIGMVGSKQLPPDAMMWNGKRIGNVYCSSTRLHARHNKPFRLEDGLEDVLVIDGFIMITSHDIVFRTDLFDGWDFYDVSTSFEYKKRGYRVVIPKQQFPWCLHDDGKILSLWNYDKYRHITIKEYGVFFHE